MIAGAVASQNKVVPAYTGPLPSYIGGTFSAVSAQTHTLAAPGGLQTGDLLVAVISCRGDRSFTVPTGWTARVNALQTGQANSNGKRDYVLTKAFAGESSFAFVQSVTGAAAIGLVAYRNAGFSQVVSVNAGDTATPGLTASITPAASSIILGAMTAMWVNRSTGPSSTPDLRDRGFASFAESNGAGGQSVGISDRDARRALSTSQTRAWPLQGSSTGHRVLHLIELAYTG